VTQIANVSRGQVLCRRAVLGITFWPRFRGLMFRREFAPFDGLWLAPTSAIHMFWVRFAIDLIWLDNGLRVVAVTEELGPWRCKRVAQATSVLELPAGVVKRTGTAPGDAVAFGEVRLGRSRR